MRLAVVGDPVGHSLSPLIQTAALAHVGIPGTYEARRVDAAGMGQVIAELRSGELRGVNVTMPHKRLAREAADLVDADAARAGAVNTLLSVPGCGTRTLRGINTDIYGIRVAWERAGLPDDAPVLLLGAGGAAAAALVALDGRAVAVAARRREAATAVVEQVGVAARCVTWSEPILDAVVVNATPLGMNGEALDEAVLESASGLFDMAYGDRPTPAVEKMRAAGKPVVDGPDMLIAQAARAFTYFTGHPAPQGAMRRALDGA